MKEASVVEEALLLLAVSRLSVVAKQLQEQISVAGARSFARVYQSRPRTSYGSFGGQSAPIVVDESEIVEWSKSVKPEDFAGPRGSSDNDSGKDVKG